MSKKVWQDINPFAIECSFVKKIYKPEENIVIIFTAEKDLKIKLVFELSVNIKTDSKELIIAEGKGELNIYAGLPGKYEITVINIKNEVSNNPELNDFLLIFDKKKYFFDKKPICIAVIDVKW